MTVPVLIAGLILTLAGSHWFSGAGTVGVILIAAGALGLLIQMAVLWFAARSFKRTTKSSRRGW